MSGRKFRHEQAYKHEPGSQGKKYDLNQGFPVFHNRNVFRHVETAWWLGDRLDV